MALAARPATPADAERIAQIYNEGIEDRVGTFETRPRSTGDIRAWFDGRHPIVVVEDEGEIVAFASTSNYRTRECYAGIAEFSVYVARVGRGRGAGTVAMRALIDVHDRLFGEGAGETYFMGPYLDALPGAVKKFLNGPR